MSKQRWFRVTRVEPNSRCEACQTEVTRDQQRHGQARKSDAGAVRHGSCQPKEDEREQK